MRRHSELSRNIAPAVPVGIGQDYDEAVLFFVDGDHDRSKARVKPTLTAVDPTEWITTAPNAPYFMTESGTAWTPIGHNDALTWPELRALQCGNLAGVARHFQWLRDNGVTCIRLMLEYCEDGQCYFERPAGHIRPAMVALWDDLVGLCAETGLRLLLTPYLGFGGFWVSDRAAFACLKLAPISV